MSNLTTTVRRAQVVSLSINVHKRPLFQAPGENLPAGAGRKPGSVPTLPPVMVIPLGRPLPDGSCDLLEI